MSLSWPAGHRSALALMSLMYAMTALACGSPKTRDQADPIQRTPVGTPVDYLLEDPTCQTQAGADLIGAQDIHFWAGGSSSVETHDFSRHSVDGRDGSSNLIAGTLYGFHMRSSQSCVLSENGSIACDDTGSELVQEAQELKLCRPAGPYSRDSIEGVTLASIANLERAYDLYRGLNGARWLKRPYLLVMPKYETVITVTHTAEKTTMTHSFTDADNAAFGAIPTDEGRDVLFFLVYPKSLEATNKPEWRDVRFWEVPWVMAHEFAHHVFYSYYRQYRQDSAATTTNHKSPWQERPWVEGISSPSGIWQGPRPDFRPERPRDTPRLGFELQGPSPQPSVNDALGAVNEGYADLMAAYILGAEKDHTAGIPCFEKTRDLRSPLFADGAPKVLTEVVRNTYFLGEESESDEPCATSWKDSHHIGAIVAHGVHLILSTSFGDVTTSQEKGSAALAWLVNFDAERAKKASVTADDIFVLAIKAALVTVKAPQVSTAPQCSIVRSIFPYYASALGC